MITDKALLSAFAQAVVAGDGTASVTLAPHGEWWEVTRLSVKASSNTREATATYFLTTANSGSEQETSYAGSSGDSTDMNTFMTDGDRLIIQWENADVGATVTATVRGWKKMPDGGFRARR